MVTKDNIPDFVSEWKKYENKIISTLKNRHDWKTDNYEVWQDIKQDAAELCFKNFSKYDPRKGSVFAFLLTTSQHALLRNQQDFNKTTFGDERLNARIKDISALSDAITNEGNSRIIIAFMLRHYVKIKPQDFNASGYADLSLEKLFPVIKEGVVKFFSTKKAPSWYSDAVSGILDLLWKKIFPIKNEIFIKTGLDRSKLYTKLSIGLKMSFNNNNSQAKKKAHNQDIDDCDCDDEFINRNVDPEKLLHISSIKPDDLALCEEFATKRRDLLFFAIKYSENPRYLIAFLLKICSIKPSEFIQRKYHTLKIGELVEIFKNEFLSRTYLANQKLESVFAELDKKTIPFSNEIFYDEGKKLNLPDWANKANVHTVKMLEKRATALSRELLDYFDGLYNKKKDNCK